MFERYMRMIKNATDDIRLNSILETAAFDDRITHEEYSTVYEKAFERHWEIIEMLDARRKEQRHEHIQ